MATPTPGEQFVRTLRHYLEANQHRLLILPAPSSHPTRQAAKATTTAQIPQQQNIKETPTPKEETGGIFKAVTSLWSSSPKSRPTNVPTPPNSITTSKETISTGRPTSLYGIPIPYMSLLAATSPNATSLSNTPYMPLRSSLTLDIHYLYFLLVQFEYLGLEETHLPVPPEHGLVETETTSSAGQAPSIVSSVGSVMSTLSLSTGWQFWNNKGANDEKKNRPLHEDIVWIHRYLSKITALKLNMTIITTTNGITKSGQRTILGYEQPLPQDGSISLPLNAFKNLQYLELSHIHPACISNWSELKHQLVSLVIKVGNIDNAADIIGEEDEEWPKLKMLSLADNSLTTLESEPANKVRNLTHLNLSSNLLIDIPAALASLYNLTSLNLSYNMISFTTGINTVLGNIQELDLRGNRLTLLAGLDRLWALERLDVRDNRIDDATEIGRLTALPNIQDIWVEGNPFTKLQPDYRVDIFTLFKKNDQDIELDGTKPSFNERRRIHAPENQNFNHHGPSTPSAAVVDHRADTTTNNIPPNQWPPAIHHEQDGTEDINDDVASVKSQPTIVKTKKLAKAKTKGNKRIIKLGGSSQVLNEPPIAALEEDKANTSKYVHRLAELEEAVQQEQVIARRAASVRSRRSNKKGSKKAAAEAQAAATAAITEEGGENSATTPKNEKRNSDAFRRKIEAMRREAGTEWLRVLQEMDVVKKSQNATPSSPPAAASTTTTD